MRRLSMNFWFFWKDEANCLLLLIEKMILKNFFIKLKSGIFYYFHIKLDGIKNEKYLDDYSWPRARKVDDWLNDDNEDALS